jgi:4-amino-4-deoxy-L-arabinose transferase-like glycosyltransferase
MNFRQTLDAAILIAATALTRFMFRSHYLYDIDSVNFALALKRFDPSVHQPHPPGYFLYVCLGRLANLIFHDANTALIAISIVFSCGAAAMIYVLANNWFGRNAATFAGLIFIFSPLAWFHGTVALTYIVEAFFSALTGYLCWRIYCGAARFMPPGAVVVGIAAGFRPSSLLLLVPLLLFSFRKASRKQAACGVGALALTLLAWFIPMIWISGGTSYVSSLLSLWLTVPSRGMVFNSSPLNSFARAWVIVGIYFLCFGCAAILPLWGLRGNSSIDRRKTIFTRVWIAPGLLFFTFIYLKFVNSGYLLALAPPICAWMGLWTSTWYANPRMRRGLKVLVIGGCATANTLIFIRAPVYCSYGEVQRFERELENIIKVLPQIASARDTMIVGFDSHFLGYRHAGYYLPDYVTVEFPEVQLTSGTRVFVMTHRDTRLEGRLPAAFGHNFIIFPLPVGDNEYSEYMAVVRKRFDPGELRMIVRGGQEFAIGPVADLQVLFPSAALPAGTRVHGH